MSASPKTSPTHIELAAVALTTAAVVYTYLTTPSLFWPLTAALLAATALAAHSPMAVSRRMTFLAHAQAHTILTAALLAALVAIPLGLPPLGYVLAVLLAAVGLNLSVTAVAKLGYREDVATGIVMSFQLSASVALLHLLRTHYAAWVDPLSLITGEYLFVTWRDVAIMAPFVAVSMVFPLAFHKKYLYTALDMHYAQSLGIRVRLYDVAFVTSMSTAVAGGVYTLGALMPSVLLVLPGAIASRHNLTRQLPTSISIALLSTSAAHFLYTLLPWLWPTAALGLTLLAAFFATKQIYRH